VRERSWWRRSHLAIAGSAAVAGGIAVAHYSRVNLTLSHYDARGHLVVARRVVDSLTPGWQQIGAVWLPLPHLLNTLPIQVDWLFRTGASAIALSVVSFALTAAAVAWIVEWATGSRPAALCGVLALVLNPNVLYLQATPMTEPLLMALSAVAVALLIAWCERISGPAETAPARVRDAAPSPHLVGAVFAAACLTRYEAWPVTIGALIAAVMIVKERSGLGWHEAARRMARVAVYPLAAIVGFCVFSRIVVGAWFASGFFIPENPARGLPAEAIRQVIWGLNELSGTGLMVVSTIGALELLRRALLTNVRAAILPLALLGMVAVPLSAFVDGHPFRIRYMVPLIALQAICTGVAAGCWKRGRPLIIGVLVIVVAIDLRPFDAAAPMVVEAQWDRPNFGPRDAVTRYLATHYARDGIMVSMGSLGHYMQDLSQAGFSVADFLHEGNGDIWLNALHSPRPYAGWILVEEKAEGGDMLAVLGRDHPEFLDGYSRVCEGAGLALYRRAAPATRTSH
jgi:hypothetical protein